VAIAGLYPSFGRPMLVSTWSDYETLLYRDVPLAIDLSHLNIVRATEGTDAFGLLEALLASPRTLEVHLSANDGRTDRHLTLAEPPFWWQQLSTVHDRAICFTEGNHLRNQRFHTQGERA
jgi:hypothetical protein